MSVLREQAGLLVGRLAAQWPSIGDTDLGADDWVNAICGLGWERGRVLVDEFVNGWTKDRPPRVADWQEAAREHARRDRLTAGPARGELEAAPASRERVAALIERARRSIGEAKRPVVADRAVPLVVSRYDRVPIHWGKPGTTMTPEERAAQLAEVGERRVRQRRVRDNG